MKKLIFGFLALVSAMAIIGFKIMERETLVDRARRNEGVI